MSHRVRSVFVLASMLILVATLVFRLGTGVSVAAVSSTLHASVGPGFVISLAFDDGSAVLALPAGTYRVVVDDQGQDHNFHLLGPGVDESTSVESLASTSWTVTFRNNSRYDFLCDPHADSMFGRFETGAVADEPASSGGGGGGGSGAKPGSASPPKATGKILATVLAGVDSAGKLRLTLEGKPVKTLGQGSYKLVIVDSSKKNDVILRRIGSAATPLTGLSFVGSRTVTTQLETGKWKLYTSPREAASAVFFRVTKS